MASNIQKVYTDQEQDILERNQLVNQIALEEGVSDTKALQALRRVPRHWFVPAASQAHAYANRPLPLSGGQTISQPFIVAFAAQELRLTGAERVLEIGAGSGYQAAVLAELAAEVFAVEQDAGLCAGAHAPLEALGQGNVHLVSGDGKRGHAAGAPYDRVLASCAVVGEPPRAWFEQLVPGGFLLFPHAPRPAETQWMERWTRGATGWENKEKILPVKFVPLL